MDGENPFRRDDVEIPRGGDLVRQLVIVGVVLVAWVGAFNFGMNLPTESTESARADERRAERIRAAAVADSTAAAADEDPSADGMAAGGETADGDPTETESGTNPVTEMATIEPTASDPAPPDPAPAEQVAVTTPAPAPTETTEPETPAELDPVTAIEREEAMANMPDVSDHPPVSFAAEVMPIFDGRCLQCHGKPRDDGSLRIEEGLDMRTHEAIMAGSTWGDVVVPGDPVGSYMLELILDGEMPDEGPRLLPREVRIITAWIAQGAPDN